MALDDIINMIKRSEKPISPVTFTTPGAKEKAVSFMDKDINKEDNFAINKLTANGKYVRGNMLYYVFNGVEIYTELNNIIFVDVNNNTLFIREYEKLQRELTPDNPEEKQYIVLYTDLGYEDGDDAESFPLRWEAYQGRTNAYNSIKANVPVIDADRSIVLVETAPLKDALSVRQFIKYLQTSDLVDDKEYDIDEYANDYM